MTLISLRRDRPKLPGVWLAAVVLVAAGILTSAGGAFAQSPAGCDEYAPPNCGTTHHGGNGHGGHGGNGAASGPGQSTFPGVGGGGNGGAGGGGKAGGGNGGAGSSGSGGHTRFVAGGDGVQHDGRLPITGYPTTPLILFLAALLLGGILFRVLVSARGRLAARGANGGRLP